MTRRFRSVNTESHVGGNYRRNVALPRELHKAFQTELLLYEYAHSAPCDYSDPTGLFSIAYHQYVANQWTCCKCLVYSEAGGESGACMDAVAWILRNRMKDGFASHRRETDFCKQAHLPKTFVGGHLSRRYQNCLGCAGNQAETNAMDRAGSACTSMINGSTDPTGGAHYWYTRGQSPAFLKDNPKCTLVTIAGCKLDIWKCSKEPLASDTLRTPNTPRNKPKK